MHPIIYIFLLGKRQDNWNPLIPFEELVNPYLMTLSAFPQSLEHFAFGLDFYSGLYCSGSHQGYMVLFVYEDTIDKLNLDNFKFYKNEVVVFFLCTENSDCKAHISVALCKNHKSSYLYVCPHGSGFMDDHENVFHDKEDVYRFLFELTPRYIDLTKVEDAFSVHYSASDADRGLHFLPTRPNTFTLHHIYGNWGFPSSNKTHDEEMELRGKAVEEANTFNRQRLILEQIQQLASLEQHAGKLIENKRHRLRLA